MKRNFSIESDGKTAVAFFFDAGRDPFSGESRTGWHVDYYADGERVADSNRVWHQALPRRRDAATSVRKIAARHLRNLVVAGAAMFALLSLAQAAHAAPFSKSLAAEIEAEAAEDLKAPVKWAPPPAAIDVRDPWEAHGAHAGAAELGRVQAQVESLERQVRALERLVRSLRDRCPARPAVELMPPPASLKREVQ